VGAAAAAAVAVEAPDRDGRGPVVGTGGAGETALNEDKSALARVAEAGEAAEAGEGRAAAVGGFVFLRDSGEAPETATSRHMRQNIQKAKHQRPNKETDSTYLAITCWTNPNLLASVDAVALLVSPSGPCMDHPLQPLVS
jgi:hypothetical protein